MCACTFMCVCVKQQPKAAQSASVPAAASAPSLRNIYVNILTVVLTHTQCPTTSRAHPGSSLQAKIESERGWPHSARNLNSHDKGHDYYILTAYLEATISATNSITCCCDSTAHRCTQNIAECRFWWLFYDNS